MLDPIILEVLRGKIDAIAQDGAKTIMRTAISPVIADNGDCSCSIYSADGELLSGGGPVFIHYHSNGAGVRKIIELHGQSVADGDIFLVNDPYQGGGLHAQDVVIHVPVFCDGALAAWVGTSGHMMDMGGSVLGSFSTSATECIQEALRFPPIRVYRAGQEQTDIWAILRTNIRMSDMVETDIRSLISGANIAQKELQQLVRDYGIGVFKEAMATLCDLTEREMRRAILELEPGSYYFVSWSEWSDKLYRVPCTLMVDGDHLTFDFSGASPQTPHYFNSKAYVIKALIGVVLHPYLGHDLPLNEGVFRVFDVVCEAGSILDAQPPAPIGAPHMDVGQTALEVAMRALNMAIAASPGSRARTGMSGPSAGSGFFMHTLAGKGRTGRPDGWLMMDGGSVGASAGHDRDTPDYYFESKGNSASSDLVDIEVLESWYPIHVNYRRVRRGAGGAGMHRSGAGCSMSYRISGTSELTLTIMGQRERVPIAGVAGGLPGALTRIHHQDHAGNLVPIPCHQEGVVAPEGRSIIFDCPSGGGWGDPLERDPGQVEADFEEGRLTPEEARTVYGVILGDAEATSLTRRQMLAQRLAIAEPPRRSLSWTPELIALSRGSVLPLDIGVDQQGGIAVSARSGAPLSLAPDHWTMGCPRIPDFLETTPDVSISAYLDPATGHLLLVDVVARGECELSVGGGPSRWLDFAHASVIAAE